MPLRVVTPPTAFLLTRDEAKLACAIDFDDHDALIDRAIAAAQRIIQAKTQRLYCAQELEWVLDGLCDPMVLPVAPGGDHTKIEITSVRYADLQTGEMTELDPALYWVRPTGPTLKIVRRWFAWWPWVGDAAERVVVAFRITSTPADAPEHVLTAMQLLVAHLYKHREAVVGIDSRDSPAALPLGVEDCLCDERWDAC